MILAYLILGFVLLMLVAALVRRCPRRKRRAVSLNLTVRPVQKREE